MGSSFIISCQEAKERVNDFNNLLNVLCKSFQPNIKLESSSLIQASNKGRWFISSFSFKLMDMVIFRASFNNQWPLDWFKMQTLTTWNKMFITIYDIMGNMANDPRTNVLAITKGNGFFGIERFFETWSLCLQTYTIHIPNEKATFWSTKIQNNKRGKKPKQVACILPFLVSILKFGHI